jgi:hypothetical protein
MMTRRSEYEEGRRRRASTTATTLTMGGRGPVRRYPAHRATAMMTPGRRRRCSYDISIVAIGIIIGMAIRQRAVHPHFDDRADDVRPDGQGYRSRRRRAVVVVVVVVIIAIATAIVVAVVSAADGVEQGQHAATRHPTPRGTTAVVVTFVVLAVLALPPVIVVFYIVIAIALARVVVVIVDMVVVVISVVVAYRGIQSAQEHHPNDVVPTQ